MFRNVLKTKVVQSFTMEPNCPGLNPDPLDISCMTIGNLTPLGVGSVFLGIYLQFHFHLRFIFILFNYLYDVCLHLRVCIGDAVAHGGQMHWIPAR